MNNRRAKLMAGATVLGLGALGGAALGTNQGIPAASQQLASTGASGQVVTSASGAAASASETVAARTNPGARAPIVTRASGGAAPSSEIDD